MHRVRILQIVAALVVALAGCVLLLLNVQTSDTAWRRTNPTATQGKALNIPEKQPARDASGPRGWSWQAGTPGWRPGERIQGYPIAGAGAEELINARVSAAHAGVAGAAVRVVVASRAVAANRAQRLLAILAAPAADDPARTCLAPMLGQDAKVEWFCPGRARAGRELGNSPVLIAATSFDWHGARGADKHRHPLYLVGVARGDVRRIVLSAPGFDSEAIYTRGHTWGQFDAAWTVIDRSARLSIYGRSGLLEVIRLALGPGQTRVFY